MAFSAVPTVYFSAYDYATSTMKFPISCVPEITAGEADAVTGDIRAIMFSLLEQMYVVWNALATANKSTKMTITRSQSLNQSTTYITRSYTYTFVLSPTDVQVVPE